MSERIVVAIQGLTTALATLENQVVNGWSSDASLQESFGWNHAALNRHQLAAFPKNLALRIAQSDALVESDDEELFAFLNDATLVVSKLSTIVPYLFNGNGVQSVPAYVNTLSYIDFSLSRIIEPWTIPNKNSFPSTMARRLDSTTARLDDVNLKIDGFETFIKSINDAASVAESLPTTLRELKEAKEKTERSNGEVIQRAAELQSIKEAATKLFGEVQSVEAEAKTIRDHISEIHLIATSTGLAASFEMRMRSLMWSYRLWVSFLVLSLATGATVGFWRGERIINQMALQNPRVDLILIEIGIAVVGLTAPLWMAWLSTKQLSQKTQLAEDYAYKSSISKAYEGYRREAIRFGAETEEKLFNTTINRFNELPSRHFDRNTSGTPLQDVISSIRTVGQNVKDGVASKEMIASDK
jgi:uncharacterized protein YneF (UPF0154 family)